MVRATLRTLAAVWLATTLAFFVLRVLPGDAIQAQLVSAGFSLEIVAERRAAAGLDQPLPTQYIEFLTRLIRGDLGHSLYTGESVRDAVADRAGSTLSLAAYGFAVMIATSILLAIGASRGGRIGRGARVGSILAVGLPSYVTGTLLILLVGLADAQSQAGLWSAAFVLGYHAGGPIAIALAESIRQVRRHQFVVAAEARGLHPLSVELRHVLRNAILPVLPLAAAQTGFLLTGTVITEVVFARPGLGRLMLDSVLRRDLPVVQGLVILAALTYGGCLLAADLAARVLDPRMNG